MSDPGELVKVIRDWLHCPVHTHDRVLAKMNLIMIQSFVPHKIVEEAYRY